MSIARPWMLWLLLSVVPVALIQVREYLKGRSELLLLWGRWREETVRNLFMVKWFFASLTFQIFLIFSILSVAGFSWGQRSVEETRRGVDLVVAFDLSRSMLATDVEPSRLERAVSTLRSVAGRVASLRMGIVGFKGTAVTLLPLTEDLVAVESLLEGLSPSLISAPGTNVERGLLSAMDAYPAGTYAHRLILLISDGESLSGDPLVVIDRATEEGFTVFSLMAGTPAGSAIPLPSGDVVRDASGNAVVTRADGRVLQTLAEQTGGEFLILDQTEPGAIVRAVERFAQERTMQARRLVDIERYRAFLGVALLALTISVAIRVVKWRSMF